MNFNLTFAGQMISFVVFVLFCMKYIWPPLTSMMRERQKAIADGLNKAAEAEQQLEQANDAAATELEEAKKQAADLIAQARSRASQIEEEAKAKASEEADRIIAGAQAEIDQEIGRAREELRPLAKTPARRLCRHCARVATHGFPYEVACCDSRFEAQATLCCLH